MKRRPRSRLISIINPAILMCTLHVISIPLITSPQSARGFVQRFAYRLVLSIGCESDASSNIFWLFRPDVMWYRWISARKCSRKLLECRHIRCLKHEPSNKVSCCTETCPRLNTAHLKDNLGTIGVIRRRRSSTIPRDVPCACSRDRLDNRSFLVVHVSRAEPAKQRQHITRKRAYTREAYRSGRMRRLGHEWSNTPLFLLSNGKGSVPA